ncbi:hypothetical protein [Nonomuraea sp. NPDC049684]|uniref:hypothetical protein n=1 Tax=Nonomuraea sp. NPDC049684 TaxID=3364356 RepID=UPI00379ACCA4
MAEQPVQGSLAVVDRGAFVVGEGDGGKHVLQVVLGLQQQRLGGVLRGVEVAFGAGHPVLALLEEGVVAEPVSQVGVLPRLAGGRGPVLDGFPVDQDLDGSDVAFEVARVAVGPGQCVRGDLGVVLGGVG